MDLYGVFNRSLEETLTSGWPGTFYGNPCPKGHFVRKKYIGPIAINIFRSPCQAFSMWTSESRSFCLVGRYCTFASANLRLMVFILTCSPFSASLALASRSRRVKLRLNSATCYPPYWTLLASLLSLASHRRVLCPYTAVPTFARSSSTF